MNERRPSVSSDAKKRERGRNQQHSSHWSHQPFSNTQASLSISASLVLHAPLAISFAFLQFGLNLDSSLFVSNAIFPVIFNNQFETCNLTTVAIKSSQYSK